MGTEPRDYVAEMYEQAFKRVAETDRRLERRRRVERRDRWRAACWRWAPLVIATGLSIAALVLRLFPAWRAT